MKGPLHRSLTFALLVGALLLPSAAMADRGRADGSDKRDNIIGAQRDLSRQFGGRKLNQTWRGDELLMVWQTESGRRLLVEVDPDHGGWKVLRDENSRR